MELRRPCPECRAAMLAPGNAGILACPTCESWSLNPGLSAATQARAESILSEQHRIAALLNQVFAAADRWLGGPPPAGPDLVRTHPPSQT
jgi:hypothetical protein